jgi:hypothetical protein
VAMESASLPVSAAAVAATLSTGVPPAVHGVVGAAWPAADGTAAPPLPLPAALTRCRARRARGRRRRRCAAARRPPARSPPVRPPLPALALLSLTGRRTAAALVFGATAAAAGAFAGTADAFTLSADVRSAARVCCVAVCADGGGGRAQASCVRARSLPTQPTSWYAVPWSRPPPRAL